MRNRGLHVHPTRRDQSNGVLKVRLGADIRKDISETALAEEVNVEK
jgi:hypothetical protein